MVLLCVDNSGVTAMNLLSDNLVFQNINIDLDAEQPSIRALTNSKSPTFIIEQGGKKFSVILDDGLKVLKSDSINSRGDIILHPLSFDPANIAISAEVESSVRTYILFCF